MRTPKAPFKCVADEYFSVISCCVTFKLRDLRGCAFATPVSQPISKVKESFGGRLREEIFFLLFVFASLVGIGVSVGKAFVPLCLL
jgi:hypothetical protein